MNVEWSYIERLNVEWLNVRKPTRKSTHRQKNERRMLLNFEKYIDYSIYYKIMRSGGKKI
jgi:hypothetical protein